MICWLQNMFVEDSGWLTSNWISPQKNVKAIEVMDMLTSMVGESHWLRKSSIIAGTRCRWPRLSRVQTCSSAGDVLGPSVASIHGPPRFWFVSSLEVKWSQLTVHIFRSHMQIIMFPAVVNFPKWFVSWTRIPEALDRHLRIKLGPAARECRLIQFIHRSMERIMDTQILDQGGTTCVFAYAWKQEDHLWGIHWLDLRIVSHA